MKSDAVATTGIFSTMLVIEVFCWYVRFVKGISLAIFGITPIPVLACLCYMFWYQSSNIQSKFLMIAFLFDFIADNLSGAFFDGDVDIAGRAAHASCREYQHANCQEQNSPFHAQDLSKKVCIRLL